MPIYEYACPHCSETFEEWLKSDDESSAHPCPKCGQSAQRLISNTSFILKGGGWYVTEYGTHKNDSESANPGGESDSGKNAATAEAPAESGKADAEKSASEPAKSDGAEKSAVEKPAATESQPAASSSVKESKPATKSAAAPAAAKDKPAARTA